MFRQWLTLVIIVLVYIPVAIDATVLHVAAPTLSMTLGASGNELLWIIDIYSLVMAGMVLPMGALGDRIGFKRLLMLGGTLFGLASLAAAFSHTASWLIATRVLLAIGAAMIVPATLAGIRATFCEEKHRNMALGVWAAVGSGGAAFGPLIGGILLEHFYWGSVFLINVPIVLVVMGLTARYVPRQAGRRDQPLNQAKEVSVTVGGNTSSTASHEDVSLSPGIATELWQNVGPCADVISNAVVTTVVERTVVSEFQTSKRQTGFVFVSALAFSTVAFELIFPLAKTG